MHDVADTISRHGGMAGVGISLNLASVLNTNDNQQTFWLAMRVAACRASHGMEQFADRPAHPPSRHGTRVT